MPGSTQRLVDRHGGPCLLIKIHTSGFVEDSGDSGVGWGIGAVALSEQPLRHACILAPRNN
eukprot:5472668-Amphidinium_carterae.1